ncbi:MAG: transcriptional regulator, partial [Pseudonocardiales bacterium]
SSSRRGRRTRTAGGWSRPLTLDVGLQALEHLLPIRGELLGVSLLAAAQWADFKYIRDQLNLSDSALSKQLSALESVGYVEIHKGFVGKRPRTSANLSKAGRQAFEQHAAALQQILASSQQQVDPRADGAGRPADTRPLSCRVFADPSAPYEPALVGISATENPHTPKLGTLSLIIQTGSIGRATPSGAGLNSQATRRMATSAHVTTGTT